ncbi:hypothetical protein K469DRAFT_694469 [Zopfia rhizophila CBS 207.26]|uniref:Uncharacterized protein n=1 Tax=Zopfia rhizophila CBS 207.26 TaxID=1314779 RepID=A0A6A6ENL2_9PEZI|nr:hypothetical protein K469DRAFT_694469 [Zopfia rhizophila CBS 207.26]
MLTLASSGCEDMVLERKALIDRPLYGLHGLQFPVKVDDRLPLYSKNCCPESRMSRAGRVFSFIEGGGLFTYLETFNVREIHKGCLIRKGTRQALGKSWLNYEQLVAKGNYEGRDETDLPSKINGIAGEKMVSRRLSAPTEAWKSTEVAFLGQVNTKGGW